MKQSTYFHQSWYVAAWSRDIDRSLTVHTILGESIVLFRDSKGTVAALENRCAHRHVPLSAGALVGDEVECAYHGLRYDGTGQCVRVPSQERVPSRAKVKSYPIVERHGWVWIWMGAAEAADPTKIPDFSKLSDPQYAATGGTKLVRANYELITDNLMDLSHVGFVHRQTIGNAEMGEKGTLKVERSDTGVRVTRWVIDVPAPPTYIKTGRVPADSGIDRWQIIDFEPPCYVHIHVGGVATGTGAPEGHRDGGLGIWVMNAMTPIDETSSNYYWAIGRDFHPDNPQLTAFLHDEVSRTFDEDLGILELQQKAIAQHPDAQNVDILADAGGVQARRLLRGLIEDQQQCQSGSPVPRRELAE
ncbi:MULTISPECIES: aromatic ring-hydroxylating dioxygenase subunit alpha [unclassified Beijerinckia]|uniref:aromatic ring-hydroxylating dioxygenase subunit alpha n=1 Tax=unclassified Beijerinckia TaxID=2638183 RepID=UPI00089AEC47|nr:MULTISPECIES: aromatic ring-hydroxylating dioxygenase subunit alpha [unclassified Beijerinckia]MDH7796138.1 phenylpropionate dioxygenase-like ring-hydroxylating dioxygenase large terminal subunit [Beijerinckia sp. GAS462]SEC31964.1 vanillate O-demethylase monooxygenase subunit [Beijerinckia sp. 28-YEA-48]